ncbi:hypothetical protein GUITHDRAFT_151265, partial [Guillardia theta CCMP2712]
MVATVLQHAVYNAALLRACEGGGGPAGGVQVETSLHTLPGRSVTAQPQSFMLSFLLTLAFLYPPSYIAEEMVSERERRLKHMLFVAGARSLDFWLAQISSDVLLLMLIALATLILGAATHSPVFMSSYALASSSLMLCFAFAMSALTYALTFLFSSSKAVLKYMSTVLLFVTTIPLSLLFSLALVVPNLASSLSLILSVFPALAFAWSLFLLSVNAIISHDLKQEDSLSEVFFSPDGILQYHLILLLSGLVYLLM